MRSDPISDDHLNRLSNPFAHLVRYLNLMRTLLPYYRRARETLFRWKNGIGL